MILPLKLTILFRHNHSPTNNSSAGSNSPLVGSSLEPTKSDIEMPKTKKTNTTHAQPPTQLTNTEETVVVHDEQSDKEQIQPQEDHVHVVSYKHLFFFLIAPLTKLNP